MTREQFRIVGDEHRTEAFIPLGGPRSAAIVLKIQRWARGEYTAEERAEMERYHAAAAAKQEAEWAANLVRHVQLCESVTHPLLAKLLEAHGPHVYPETGRPGGYACHSCAQYE